MKQIVSNYTYSPTANCVTLTGLNIDQDQLLLVVAPQVGRTLYNFASVTGTVIAGTDTRINLTASTAGLTTTSSLVIFYDDQLSAQSVFGTVTIGNTVPVSLASVPTHGVTIASLPASTVTISNFPASTTVTGTVSLDPASLAALENVTVTIGSSVTVSGTVAVGSINQSTLVEGISAWAETQEFPVRVSGWAGGDNVGISGTVTANGGNFAFAQNEDTTIPPAKGVLIGWRNDSTGEFKNASDAEPLPISGTVTANLTSDVVGNDGDEVGTKGIKIGFNDSNIYRTVSNELPLPVKQVNNTKPTPFPFLKYTWGTWPDDITQRSNYLPFVSDGLWSDADFRIILDTGIWKLEQYSEGWNLRAKTGVDVSGLLFPSTNVQWYDADDNPIQCPISYEQPTEQNLKNNVTVIKVTYLGNSGANGIYVYDGNQYVKGIGRGPGVSNLWTVTIAEDTVYLRNDGEDIENNGVGDANPIFEGWPATVKVERWFDPIPTVVQSLPPISGTVTANNPNGNLVTHFGSVVTASEAQLTSCVTNASRKYLLVQNISTTSVTIGIGFYPTTTQGIQLGVGAGMTFDSFVPTGAIYWLSSVTNSNFTILEG